MHRGDLSGLKGAYVFGDLVKGEVYYTTAAHMRDDTEREATVHELRLWDTSGTRMRMSDFVGDGRVDLRFGTDSDRSLYLLAKANGTIWKVVDTRRAPIDKDVEPSLADDVVAAYDFEHPFAANDSYEVDEDPPHADPAHQRWGADAGRRRRLPRLQQRAAGARRRRVAHGDGMEGGRLRERRGRRGLAVAIQQREGDHGDRPTFGTRPARTRRRATTPSVWPACSPATPTGTAYARCSR